MNTSAFSGLVNHLKKEGARRVALFGSFARGEQKKGSDIDLLVEFKPVKGLLDIARIERTLTKKAGRKVELITPQSLSPHIRRSVQSEMKVLYAA